MREVQLWVQTRQAARAQIVYFEPENPARKYRTAAVQTEAGNVYVAHLLADSVLPGKHYRYELYLNGQQQQLPYALTFQTQPHWQWRGLAPDFSFAVGSCAYVNEPYYDRPGEPYGGGYPIFTSIVGKKPDFMVWLGDNIYLRETDWNSRTGMLHRYTYTRSLPEMQPLLGSVHHYATWDDHDYGPDNSDRSFWNKELSKEAFKLFWANPNYRPEGIAGTFTWNDAQFFLLDDRWFRSNLKETRKHNRKMLGEEQIQWLIDGLLASQSTFKFICIGSQTLNSDAAGENYAAYPTERKQLLGRIRKAGITGVIFLDGDRHHTVLSKMKRTGTYPLYGLTCSPLTAGIHKARESNENAVPGTQVGERNFSLLQVSGTEADRQVTISTYNPEGKQLWQYIIKAAELK